MPQRLAVRAWCSKCHSSLLNIYFRLGFRLSLLFIYFQYSSITCSHQRVAQKPNPYVTLHFQDRLRSVKEPSLKSPFLCVNKIPSKSYTVLCEHSVNVTLSSHVSNLASQSNLRAKTCVGFSSACNVIAFLFFAFYSFLGDQFMALNGWTLILIYLTVSKFSYINRMILVREHDKRCYQWQTG